MSTARRTASDQRERELKFVEKFGMLFERLGLTPMGGRILGWLLICEPPQQSMAELTEALHASKGSISTSLRLLTQTELVVRTRRAGQRPSYYLLPDDAWTQMMKHRLSLVGRFKDLAREGIALTADRKDTAQRRLQNMYDLYSFFEREMPSVFERWAQHRAGG